MVHLLEIKDLSVYLDGKQIITGVSTYIDKGEIVSAVGPNGSGKTTLIRAVAGFLPYTGNIFYEGVESKKLKRKQVASFLSVVPQEPPSSSLRVTDFVLLGRYPYLNRWQGEGEKDYAVVKGVLTELGISNLAERPTDKLSGGELQRVVLARGIIQGQKLMLMDEPTAHLDLKAQQDIMKLVKSFSEKRAIMATFHDLTLAGQFSDRILVLNKGKIVAQGAPEEVLNPDVIQSVYGIKVVVETTPVFHIVPLYNGI